MKKANQIEIQSFEWLDVFYNNCKINYYKYIQSIQNQLKKTNTNKIETSCITFPDENSFNLCSNVLNGFDCSGISNDNVMKDDFISVMLNYERENGSTTKYKRQNKTCYIKHKKLYIRRINNTYYCFFMKKIVFCVFLFF